MFANLGYTFEGIHQASMHGSHVGVNTLNNIIIVL